MLRLVAPLPNHSVTPLSLHVAAVALQGDEVKKDTSIAIHTQ